MSVGERDDIGGKRPSKNPPWTSEEDAILLKFVAKREGRVHQYWKQDQMHLALDRSQHSSSSRWQYLIRNPNFIPLGLLTEEEERKILQLIAARREKKEARIAKEVLDGCQESLNVDTLTSGSNQYDDFLADQYDLSDIYKTYISKYDSNTMHPSNSKHLQESGMLWDRGISSAVPVVNQYQYVDQTGDKLPEFPRLPSPTSKYGDQFHDNYHVDNHAVLDSNTYSSVPISSRATISDLPSLQIQYPETQRGLCQLPGHTDNEINSSQGNLNADALTYDSSQYDDFLKEYNNYADFLNDEGLEMMPEFRSLQYSENVQGLSGTSALSPPTFESGTWIHLSPAEQTQSEAEPVFSTDFFHERMYGPNISKGSRSETQQGCRGMPESPFPSFGSADTSFQSFLAEQTQTEPVFSAHSTDFSHDRMYGPNIRKGSSSETQQGCRGMPASPFPSFGSAVPDTSFQSPLAGQTQTKPAETTQEMHVHTRVSTNHPAEEDSDYDKLLALGWVKEDDN